MGIFDTLANTFGGGSGSNGTPLSGSGTLPEGVEQYSRMQGVLSTLDQIVKASGSSGAAQSSAGRMSPLGLDAIIQDWVRQQFIYRRSILQDLYVLAYQVTEIRSVVLAIQREIFRRGFGTWTQRFAVKCTQCGEEYDDDDIEHCQSCYAYEFVEQEVFDTDRQELVRKNVRRYKRDSSGSKVPVITRLPDKAQQQEFERISLDANSFHQTLLDVLHEFMTDVLIADDGFLLLNKEYEVDRETGQISSQKIFEITRHSQGSANSYISWFL